MAERRRSRRHRGTGRAERSPSAAPRSAPASPGPGRERPTRAEGAPAAPSPLERSDLLVTALGDEPLAPLTLARQVGACRVICVGQRYTEWRVEPLLAVLRREGCRVDWLELDVTDVPAALAELDARLPLGGDAPVVFDLTNARGVVGFALFELASALEAERPDRCRVVRVDWSDRLVRAISPDRDESEPLHVRLGLSDFLAVHGKRLLGVERARGSRSPFGGAAGRLAKDVPLAQPLLEAVHQGAWDRPLRVRESGGIGRLIDELEADGVVERRGQSLFASGLRAFQFLHGRWLEEYLFEVAEASGRFDDCASGVRFAWTLDDGRDSDVANEIDFAGTTGGRATLASCKTGFRDLNGALYEVLTLAERAAGRSVITVFATTETLDRYDRRRAAALGIRILDAERLADPARVLDTILDVDGLARGGRAGDTRGPLGASSESREPGPSRAAGRHSSSSEVDHDRA